MTEPSQFDLLAASLRADERDLDAFVAALAVKLEGALPGRVEIDRGGFLGGKRVKRMTVLLGDHEYELEAGRHLTCRRRSVVRGIALKNEELPLDAWIQALSRDLITQAEQSERGRLALERLLA